MSNSLTALASRIAELAAQSVDLATLEQAIVTEIAAGLPYYNWVGFYWLDPEDAETLVLGAFVGAATDHTRIPVSRGICGAAVAQAQTIVIDDVHADPRYLACSIETKSEIVVPVHVNGKIVGEIDIDSHNPAAFKAEDRGFLEEVCKIVGLFIEKQGK